VRFILRGFLRDISAKYINLLYHSFWNKQAKKGFFRSKSAKIFKKAYKKTRARMRVRVRSSVSASVKTFFRRPQDEMFHVEHGERASLVRSRIIPLPPDSRIRPSRELDRVASLSANERIASGDPNNS